VEPNLVMLALSKAPLREGVVDELREHATNGERIHLAGDALWIHYVGGVGRSKISPGLLDRIVGSPVTTRNWRTAVKLAEMAGVAARWARGGGRAIVVLRRDDLGEVHVVAVEARRRQVAHESRQRAPAAWSPPPGDPMGSGPWSGHRLHRRGPRRDRPSAAIG